MLEQRRVVHHRLRVAQQGNAHLSILDGDEQAGVGGGRIVQLRRGLCKSAFAEDGGGNRHHERPRLKRQPLLEEIEPDAQVAAHHPAVRPRLADFAVAVKEPPSAPAHRRR